MSQTCLEQRVVELEKAVVELQRLMHSNGPTAPAKNWLLNLSGSMKDFPEFEEVLRLGRQLREADRPDADN